MQKRRTPALLVLLLALVAAIAIACGGGGSGTADATPDPAAAHATEAARPTVDVFAQRASELVRDIGRGLEKLDRLVGRLDENITRAGSLSGGPREEPPDDWFDECCEDEEEDISDELRDAEDEIVKLIAVYQEAADEPRAEIVREMGTPLANVDALVKVLAGLPTSDGAASIVEDMSLELAALTETFTGLG